MLGGVPPQGDAYRRRDDAEDPRPGGFAWCRSVSTVAPMEPDERRGRGRIPGWVLAVVAVILGLALVIFLHVSGIMGRGMHG
jgi:hypothetical protein